VINIVVPVYNEGKNVNNLFDKIANSIKSPFEILIVYDLEEDDTLPVVNQIKDKYSFKIRTVKNSYGRGALNAIKTGFDNSSADVVLVIMADLSDSLEVVDFMYQKINDGYDIVCGSRYMKGGKQIGGPLLKKTFSRIAGVSLHYLIGIPTHDISNSFKMYRKEVIMNISIESNGGFEIGMELTVKAYIKGYKVTEVPSAWYDRANGESRFRMWQWIPKYLKWYKLGIMAIWFNRKGTLVHENNKSIPS
jgi:dolichol-phosphate mannosyltransferase